MPDGRQRTRYSEVESGLLAGREAPDEALATYRDYRTFDGLAIATAQRVFRPDGGIEELFHVQHVEAVEIEASAIRPQPGDRGAPRSRPASAR